MKRNNYLIIFFSLIIVLLTLAILLKNFGIFPTKTYDNSYFGIETYKSNTDKDGDGVDDQSDVLENVFNYIKTEPKYKSKYYATGYPDDEYGVCTDVVAMGLKGAGYDLMELLNKDILKNGQDYNIDSPDKNIDFRRVQNLRVFFEKYAVKLSTDVHDIKEWQGGDIIVFKKHIGIVSNKRNKKGVALVIHHANPYQMHYEEDILESRDDIVGHYRIS